MTVERSLAFKRTRTEKRDCDCTPARPHGNFHTYQYHRCGCDACLKAHRAYLNALETNRRTGRSAYVPRELAARRIHLLQERGVPIREQARQLGYHYGTLYRIASGSRGTKSCRREIYQDLLTLPIPPRRKKAQP